MKYLIRYVIGPIVVSMISVVSYATPYVGIGYGFSKYDTSGTSPNASVRDHKRIYSLLGGYLWSQNNYDYGVELDLNLHGKKKWAVIGDRFTQMSRVINLTAIGRYNYQRFYVEGQAGAAYVYQRNRLIVTDPATSLPVTDIGGNNHKINGVIKVGGGIKIAKGFQGSILWSRVFGQQSAAPISSIGRVARRVNFNKVATIDAVTFRLMYQFS